VLFLLLSFPPYCSILPRPCPIALISMKIVLPIKGRSLLETCTVIGLFLLCCLPRKAGPTRPDTHTQGKYATRKVFRDTFSQCPTHWPTTPQINVSNLVIILIHMMTQLGIIRGNPGVQILNPYPTLLKPLPLAKGKGLPRVHKFQPLPLPSVPYPPTPGGP
jgi:hypothetical protein